MQSQAIISCGGPIGRSPSKALFRLSMRSMPRNDPEYQAFIDCAEKCQATVFVDFLDSSDIVRTVYHDDHRGSREQRGPEFLDGHAH